MDLDPSVLWDFAGEVVGTVKPRPRGVPATVTRVDADGTVWVTTGDGTEAPAATCGAGVSVGDVVSVEWSGAQMGVTGNVSDPSAGSRAVSAVQRAVRAARSVADGAQAIANAIGQHFWADDNGAHVSTEAGNAIGARNILMNSLGILLRQEGTWLASFSDSAVAFFDGLGNTAANVVAQFGLDGARIGRESESHVSVTQNSFSLLDKHSDSYFAVEGMLGTKVMSLYSTTIKTPPSASAIDTRKTVSWQSATGQGINDLAKYDADDIVSYDLYLDGELVESDPDEMTETFSGTFATGSLALRLSLGDLQPSTTYTVRVMVRVYDEEVTLPTVRIGAEDKNHMLLDYQSMTMLDADGTEYFAVDDSGNVTASGNVSAAGDVAASGNLTASNFCDAAMTRDLGSSGTVRACRIGNMLVMSGSLSECSVSSTFTWTHLAHIDPTELGITSVGALGAMVDVNGGGPSYYGSTNGGGTARIVDGVLYADMQTNVAFSNKFVKFIITAYVE